MTFAIAIPAHNEAAVLGETLRTLNDLDYPRDRYDVYVVADYCSDDTAQVARSYAAGCYERNEGLRGRKGYALAWLLERILGQPRCYDAIVIFDADSRVSPGFLRAMSDTLSAGAWAAQGRHVIANPQASVFSSLADADMRLNNRIRNQAKHNLGLSARLMGDGMGFRRELLETHPWAEADSLTEDRAYGVYLVTQGVRVHFAPEAVSVGQAAARWGDATGQRMRWYGGVFALQQRYLGHLLAAAWRRRDLAALDVALELTLPPFSALVVATSGLVAVQAVTGRRSSDPAWWASLFLMAMTGLYPFVGLWLERAPWRSFLALVYGPFYALWRVWVGLKVRLRPGSVAWIRTRRVEELPDHE